ncbi:MAG: hypothetical protein II428_05490, partial [Muribaculaceae bacterium]|nr:hypothetical protein [Muribaculaceae bacterium]
IWLPQSGATTAPAQTTITGSGQRAEQMITDNNGKNKLQMCDFTNGQQFTINHADRMGFIPVWWFDHGKGKNYSWDDTQYTSTSAFGTEAELRALIRDYKNAGTFAIEDVVINHKGGPGMWNGSGKGRNLISENSSTGAPSTSNDVEWNYDNNVDIVDDAAHDYYSQYPYLENGNIKSESGFTGGTWGKDLRHDSENVQRNVIKYLNFLLNDLGYAGFRYDYVKGYDPKYLAMYNVATRPTFSVGEFFDGDQAYLESWIDKTYAEDTRQSAAFDFPLKFKMNEAFKNDEGNYAVLDNAGLIANYKMRRYAVTFVDNHDTFKNIPNDNTHRGFPNRMSKHVVEANMFILAMPGTPCLFYPHYMHPSWQPILQKCIKARRAAGVTNQAAISSVDKSGRHVQFNITGTKGKLKMQLGSTYSNAAVPEGVSVYTASRIEDGVLKIEPVACTILPKDTPVLLKTESKTSYEWLSRVAEGNAEIETNLFKGTTEALSVEAGSVLTLGHATDGNKAIGFWLFNGATVPANRAYLEKTAVEGVRGVAIDWNEVTGIVEIENGKWKIDNSAY